jgi:hypothetical protein
MGRLSLVDRERGDRDRAAAWSGIQACPNSAMPSRVPTLITMSLSGGATRSAFSR